MSPFIRRVKIRNYKSIAACEIELRMLTFILGPNGAGKSNFLDALKFVSDALRSSIDHALRDRGTISEVRRRSGGHPNHFVLRLDFVLPDGHAGHYAFKVGARPAGAYVVQDEECVIHPIGGFGRSEHFRVKSGIVTESSVTPMPAALPDRLLLVAASGLPAFRPVYDALSRIEVYNLNPREIANMQKPDPGETLRRDGSNAASVLQRMPAHVQKLIRDDLARIVAGVSDVKSRVLGSQETIEFRQAVKGQANPWRFFASAMSDGTLRAFGILLAVFQAASEQSGSRPPLLIGLEEPEMALHPAAASVLLSALRKGAEHCQVIVTSHSPELLDNPDIDPDSIMAVDNPGGLTRIGKIDHAGREMLRRRLFTAGELLRQNQVAPDPESLSDVSDERSLDLFDNNRA